MLKLMTLWHFSILADTLLVWDCCAGINVQPALSASSSLIYISTAANVSFVQSSLTSINAWNLTNLVKVVLTEAAGYVAFDNFVGTACNCSTTGSILSLGSDSQSTTQDLGSVSVQRSSFRQMYNSAIDIRYASSFAMTGTAFTSSIGVAAYVLSTEANVQNCTFTNIVGSKYPSTSGSYSGGALYVQASNLTVNASHFSNNVVVGSAGGAIMVSSADLTSSSTQISSSSFFNNSAAGEEGHGGALHVESSNARISDCYFEGNVGLQGGAAYLDTTEGTISNCTFYKNNATYQNLAGEDSNDGGAVYLSGQNAQNGVDNSENYVSSYMYLISNSTFTCNQGEASAGAIDAYEVNGVVDIRNCSFIGNTAHFAYGAAIYVYGSLERLTSVFLRDSCFEGNNIGQAGSVFFRSCSCVGVIGNTFANSSTTPLSVSDIGGSCEGSFDEPVLFNRSSIAQSASDNTNISNFLQNDVSTVVCVDIRDSTFVSISKTALQIHGGLSAFIVLEGLTFSNNTGGSAVNLLDCVKTVVWNSSFVGNNAAGADGGGGITSDSAILIGNSVFHSNVAWQGGALYGTRAGFTFTNKTLFVNNSALTNGGAVLCDTCGTVRFEMGSSMISNAAVGGGDGGGLYCSQCGQVQMDHSQVLNNR